MNRPPRFSTQVPFAWSGATAAAAALAVILSLAGVVSGCSRKQPPTSPPVADLPPEVASVMPPARSEGVWYETEIWAEFTAPLDSASVGPTTVFLKLDTRRIRSLVRYEPAARRIRVAPQERLDLRSTYTVEIGPGVATAEGVPLDRTYFWQFTTNSVRRPDAQDPVPGTTAESPVAALSWSGTESSAGDMQYHVYAGTDSAAVASHLVSPFIVARRYYLPNPRWPLATRVYWTVSARNRSTGETADGAVAGFETAAPDAPVDSLLILVRWGGYYYNPARRLTCGTGGTVSDPYNYIGVIRWSLESAPRDLRLAGARLFLQANTGNMPQQPRSVWATTTDPATCSIAFPGPPFADELAGALAVATIHPADPNRFRYESDAFAAHLQAAIRHGGFYGYMFRSGVTTSYSNPELWLYFYRGASATQRHVISGGLHPR